MPPSNAAPEYVIQKSVDCPNANYLNGRCDNKVTMYFTVTDRRQVQWSESLTTNHEVPVSIPGCTVGIFLEGEDSHGDQPRGLVVRVSDY